MEEFSVRYPRGCYLVLDCFDCLQHVDWTLVSPLELQIECVQVTGNVCKDGQLYDLLWVF